MAGRREFDSGKFKELVLLLAARSKDDPLMSRVKLNKLLYRCDFESFRILGQSMTGAQYVRGEFGPMAAELPGAEKDLGKRGYLGYRSEGVGPYTQKIPIALEPPDERQFTSEEHTIIAAALAELLPYGGKAASDWSHEHSAGWRVKKMDEAIPYETGIVLLHPAPDEILDEIIRRERQTA